MRKHKPSSQTCEGRQAHALQLVEEDPGYREAFQHATIEAGDALEDKLSEMAHDGNVTAAIFLLKGHRPEKYKDRRTIELDLKDWDGDLSKLSEDQMVKFLESIEKRAALMEQQQCALPAPGQAVIEATAEEITTGSEESVPDQWRPRL